MSFLLHEACYADHVWQGTVEVRENVQLAEATYRVRVVCPSIARRIVPGQFVMLRLAGSNDPLLARPLALYDTVLSASGEPEAIDIVYLVVGRMTSRLATLVPGQPLEIWGPLGNGFPPQSTDHLIMVAGGIGQTPFLALGREHRGLRRYGGPPRDVATVPKITLCYGVRRQQLLAGVNDFESLGTDVRLCTEDGSAGHHGRVTELLQQTLSDVRSSSRVVCCGPEPMMEAVAEICQHAMVPCQVSLESPMACGIGICFSCVAKVRDDQGAWDYRRTCIEGPVFDAERIVF
jgi:dihydroorotate dehydrogenase electron transfer subunit